MDSVPDDIDILLYLLQHDHVTYLSSFIDKDHGAPIFQLDLLHDAKQEDSTSIHSLSTKLDRLSLTSISCVIS